MFTNRDHTEIQTLEDQCIALAKRMAEGTHFYSESLSASIEYMNHETRKRLNKANTTNLIKAA